MELAPGVQKQQALQEAGFTSEEIDAWRKQTTQELSAAGFSTKEVGEYFGNKEPDMSGVKNFVKTNLDAHAAKKAEEAKTSTADPAMSKKTPKQEMADTFWESFQAGLQMSVSGLAIRGEMPDTVVPEDAPRFYKIASQLGTLAGDVPAMVAGAMAGAPAGTAVGGAIGSVVPGAGTAIGGVLGGTLGAGAGSFALPQGLREALIQGYEKGEIKDFADFWDRASSVFLETAKGGAIGAATMGVGGVAGKLAAPIASPLLRGAAVSSSEVATMVGVGAALEGRVPNPDEFIDAAIVVGGLKGSTKVAAKLRNIYAKTGVRPSEIVQDAQNNPLVKQELLGSGDGIPSPYKSMQEKPGEAIEIKANPELTQTNPILGEPTQVKMEMPPLPKAEVKAEPKPVNPDSQAVLDRIGETPKRAGKTAGEIYTDLIDEFHPINQFTKLLAGEKVLATKDNPYEIARLTKGNFGKADRAFEFGIPDFNDPTKTIAPSLKSTLKKIDNLDEYRAWAISAHALEREAAGFKTGIPLEEAKRVFERDKAKYEPINTEIQNYKNGLLKYLVDSEVMPKEMADQLQAKYKYHLPFNRQVEGGPGGGPGKGLKVNQPIKGAKGSELDLVDPIESLIRNTYKYIDIAEKNRVGLAMKKLAESNPDVAEKAFVKSKTEMKPIELSKEELTSLFENAPDAAPEKAMIFRPNKRPLADNEIGIFSGGKYEVYQVSDNLAAAMKGLDAYQSNLLTKMLAKPAKALRAGVSIVPEFGLKNLTRDQYTAFILSKNNFIPLLDTVSGLISRATKDTAYRDWLSHGGANAAMQSIDRNYIQQNIYKLSQETGLLNATFNVIKSPLEALRVMTELSENATRIGEFKKAMKKGKDPFEAALNSRDVTLDFARIGAKTKAFNQITAFFNVGPQGIDRTIRALQEDPVGTSAKILTSITIPSILLWWANKDDERVQKLQNWEKDLFWVIPTKDHIYRIPKPFEVGLIFGSGVERTLEAFFNDNPKAFKNFVDTLVQGFTPNYIPTFAVPVVEHFANRSTFTGNPIIPYQMEKLLPQYQYKEYTTESAKVLGKMIGSLPSMKESDAASPALIENYIRAWTGGTGAYILQASDKALIASGAVPEPVKPTATLADIPFIKAFVIRYPSASTQPILDFNEKYNRNQKYINTRNELAKRGEFDEMSALMYANMDKLNALQETRDALTTMNKTIRNIYRTKNLSPDDKRQKIDKIYYQMTKIAEQGNRIADQFEKAFKK